MAPLSHMQGQGDTGGHTLCHCRDTQLNALIWDISTCATDAGTCKGLTMDDLDHCVHIAERDWHSFYEETEECCLLQPALAGQDDSSLSDSEDLGTPVCPVPDTDQHEPRQRAEHNAEVLREAEQVCSSCTFLPLPACQTGLGDTPPEPHRSSEIEIDHSGGNSLIGLIPGRSAEQDTEMINTTLTNNHTLIEQYVISEPISDGCSASGSSKYVDDTISGPFDGAHNASVGQLTVLKTVGEESQREGGTPGVFSTGRMPQSASTHCQHAQINTNLEQLRCPGRDACQRDSCEAPRVEKERWFVTVNYSPVRHRPNAAPSGKKKKRKKKPCRGSVHRASMSEPQYPPDDSVPEIERYGMNYSEGEDITQSYRNSIAQSSPSILLEYSHPAPVSDLPQMTTISSPALGGEPSLELPLEIIDSSKAFTIQPFPDGEESENNSSAARSANTVSHGDVTFTQRNENTPQMDGIDSEHLKDDTEFFSTASYDSEDYISATESTEEPQNDARCNISQMTQSLSNYSLSASSSCLIAVANLQLTVEEDYLHCPLPHEGEGYESTADQAYLDPAKIFSCSGHSDSMMPEDSSRGQLSQHSSLSNTVMEETGHRDHIPQTDCDILASSVARGAARSPNPNLCAVTATPCSMTEGPETFTDALGPTRPVYAISTFWDEMEKLTINDILQLRISRIPSPTREAHPLQATAGARVDVTETHTENSCLADTAEYVLPDGTLMDTSDTADSDYFTHIDDSKPDRSSCEFSTFSDFDEEYYLQFLGASTNPTPEPQDLKLQSEISTESLYLRGPLQEEDIDPVGEADPVNLEQLTVQCAEDCIQNTILSDDNAFLRGLTKNKSLRNVQAFGTEMQLIDVSLNSILEEAERSLILSTYQPLADNPFLDLNSGILPRTRTPSPIITNTDILDEHYQISFPEVFEYLFGDDEPKDVSQTLLSVYDSQIISVPETYNYSLPEYEAGMLLPTLQRPQCSEEEPVPIFSCSHTAAKDLTFPELEDLLFPHDTYAQSEEEDDDSSPIRVVTRDDIQAKLPTSSLASEGYWHLFPGQSWRRDWRRWLSLRRIRFPGKGGSWCRSSGGWMFPPDPQRNMKPVETNQAIDVIDETRITPLPTRITPLQVIHLGQQFFRDLAEQQRQFKAIQTTVSLSRKDGLLFTLKQSDMCLVCIAFASWVLRSTDPQAADAWKAALLANVSTISAIQYLRRYMRRRPTEEDL